VNSGFASHPPILSQWTKGINGRDSLFWFGEVEKKTGLVNLYQKTMERSTIFHGKTHYNYGKSAFLINGKAHYSLSSLNSQV